MSRNRRHAPWETEVVYSLWKIRATVWRVINWINSFNHADRKWQQSRRHLRSQREKLYQIGAPWSVSFRTHTEGKSGWKVVGKLERFIGCDSDLPRLFAFQNETKTRARQNKILDLNKNLNPNYSMNNIYCVLSEGDTSFFPITSSMLSDLILCTYRLDRLSSTCAQYVLNISVKCGSSH